MKDRYNSALFLSLLPSDRNVRGLDISTLTWKKNLDVDARGSWRSVLRGLSFRVRDWRVG
jgi:hypothetical protein